MGLIDKLNRILDIGSKLFIFLLVLFISLIPVCFLLGHQALHIQPYYKGLNNHKHRQMQLNQLLTSTFSNLPLQAQGKLEKKIFEETDELADFVCYWLQSQGKAVVRKTLQVKQKKKTKKIEGFEGQSVSSLFEEPPLLQLKKKISKYVDFESDALESKYWVLLSAGQIDNSILKELSSLSEQNPQYKFIIVSPFPLKQKMFSSSSSIQTSPESTTDSIQVGQQQTAIKEVIKQQQCEKTIVEEAKQEQKQPIKKPKGKKIKVKKVKEEKEEL